MQRLGSMSPSTVTQISDLIHHPPTRRLILTKSFLWGYRDETSSVDEITHCMESVAEDRRTRNVDGRIWWSAHPMISSGTTILTTSVPHGDLQVQLKFKPSRVPPCKKAYTCDVQQVHKILQLL